MGSAKAATASSTSASVALEVEGSGDRGNIDHRIAVLGALYGGNFRPVAQCPKCSHRLTAQEILEGFLDSPTDVTTCCPTCRERFEAKVTPTPARPARTMVFLCRGQLLYKLRNIGMVAFRTFVERFEDVLVAARFHFTTLAGAFSELGLEYREEPALAWRTKVRPVLGKVPDLEIASTLNVPEHVIADLRAQDHIPPFRG